MQVVDAKQVKKLMSGKDRPLLVNTLPKESFDATHVPESINIPQDRDDFVEQVEGELGDREKPVIVYCASRQCDSSSQAAHKLEEAGFTNVYDFEAGAEGWTEAGERLHAGSR